MTEPVTEPVTADRPAAFFCAEYAVHPSLPIYSGGLGALAGLAVAVARKQLEQAKFGHYPTVDVVGRRRL